MTMDKLALLNVLDSSQHKTVFFGPQGFELYANSAALDTAQASYGVDANGDSLAAGEAGQWQSSWYVFARDTELGDPYFVDFSDEAMPVYTGFFGDAGWQAELVSNSLTAFLASLDKLYSQGQQSEALFVPDDTTLVDSDALNQLKAELIELTDTEHFWTMFFECYLDWLSEDY